MAQLKNLSHIQYFQRRVYILPCKGGIWVNLRSFSFWRCFSPLTPLVMLSSIISFFLPTLAQLQTYIVLWGEDSLGSCAIYFCIRIWSNSDEFCWRERSYEYTTDMWVAPSIMATIWGGSLGIWSCAIYFQWHVWPNGMRLIQKSSSNSPMSSED